MRVNLQKTKISVGKNSIFCTKCKKWIHQKCTNIKSFLTEDPNFVWKPCTKQLPPSPIVQQHLQLSDIQLEQVAKFCYLDDMIDQSGCCMVAVNARIRSARKKFHELLLILSDHDIAFERCAYIYITCACIGYNFKLAWHGPWQQKCWPDCVKMITPWYVEFVLNNYLSAYQWYQ